MMRSLKINNAVLCNLDECPGGSAIDSFSDSIDRLKFDRVARLVRGQGQTQETQCNDAIDFEILAFSICGMSGQLAERSEP